jgi:predicted O-methyltransferase YrrM
MSAPPESLYRPYNERLVAALGLDWFDIARTYAETGGTPGIYPDVALLLERLVAREDVCSIAEIGSGVSTLYLAAAAEKYGKRFVSIEEDVSWMYRVHYLLDKYGFGLTEIDHYDARAPLPKCDAVFLDSTAELRRHLLVQEVAYLWDRPWILLDDYNFLTFAKPADAFQRAAGRSSVIYQPVHERADRVVLISTPTYSGPGWPGDVEGWLKGWLP